VACLLVVRGFVLLLLLVLELLAGAAGRRGLEQRNTQQEKVTQHNWTSIYDRCALTPASQRQQ
jgi:hypothetical protein